jgi:hypothetical protein
MQAIMTIGLDIAKPVFQVHGVDENSRCTSLLPTPPSLSGCWNGQQCARCVGWRKIF